MPNFFHHVDGRYPIARRGQHEIVLLILIRPQRPALATKRACAAGDRHRPLRYRELGSAAVQPPLIAIVLASGSSSLSRNGVAALVNPRRPSGAIGSLARSDRGSIGRVSEHGLRPPVQLQSGVRDRLFGPALDSSPFIPSEDPLNKGEDEFRTHRSCSRQSAVPRTVCAALPMV
jgi:hypothetical protein